MAIHRQKFELGNITLQLRKNMKLLLETGIGFQCTTLSLTSSVGPMQIESRRLM